MLLIFQRVGSYCCKFLFFDEFLVGKVGLVEGFLVDLVFLAELLDRLAVAVFKMLIHYHCRVLPIIFTADSFFHLNLKHLPVQETNLFHIRHTPILVTEFVQIRLDLQLCRRHLFLTIRLIHFGDDPCFLLNDSYRSVTPITPSLCANVLYS